MAASVYSANMLLNLLLRGVTGTAPSSWYVALFVGDPMADGTEVSASGYARETVSFTAALNGVVRNSAEVDFGTAGADWGAISHFAVFDAATDGNMLVHDSFEAVTDVDTGTTVKIAAGVIEVSLE